jgi:hypothetical protein
MLEMKNEKAERGDKGRLSPLLSLMRAHNMPPASRGRVLYSLLDGGLAASNACCRFMERMKRCGDHQK